MKLCRNTSTHASQKFNRNRLEVAQKIIHIKEHLEKTGNQTQAARDEKIPRTTLQYWIKCGEIKSGLPEEVESFFTSPTGMAYLHRLVIAAEFTITQLGNAGIEVLKEFLHLSQLDYFVADSHGTLHQQSVAMETAMETFGQEEKARLASVMPEKNISLCQDETFHPDICLVAIEPVSNFIVLEEYSEKRDAAAWSAAMEPALSGLPVHVKQVTSDEGSGLVKYIEQVLGAHHSSDLFHAQQEITRATSASLNAKVRKAETAYQDNKDKLTRTQSKLAEHVEKQSRRIDPWQEKVDQTNINLLETERALERAKHHQEQVKTAKKTLGSVYHPYDLETGKAQTVDVISAKITEQLNNIEQTAVASNLSDNSMKYLEKAKRTFTRMLTTITFFWAMVSELISSLGVSPEMDSLIRDVLIPGFYLEIAAKKAKSAADRKKIAALAKTVLARLEIYERWLKLPDEQRERIQGVALQCAQLFQRSSSCVEGRNGQLSLHHHSSHVLSQRKLSTLTTLHNYFITRVDGTTAAERFFQEKPRDLFEHLLNTLSISVRLTKGKRVLKMAA